MRTKVKFVVNLMNKRTFSVEFDKYSFSVFSDDNYIIDGGFFGYNGRTYFTERKREIELFYKPLEEKVIKAMKSEKTAWKEMLEYQNSK